MAYIWYAPSKDISLSSRAYDCTESSHVLRVPSLASSDSFMIMYCIFRTTSSRTGSRDRGLTRSADGCV
jgi:hypothetical protein